MPDPTMILAILIVVVGCIAVTLVNLWWNFRQFPAWKQLQQIRAVDRRADQIDDKLLNLGRALNGDFDNLEDLLTQHAERIDDLCNCQTATACRVRALEMGRRGVVEMCEPVREGPR